MGFEVFFNLTDDNISVLYSSSRYYEVQILIIKLLWCGQDARTRCTSLKATCCNIIVCEIKNYVNNATGVRIIVKD
jgi:hypothetical protein